MLVIATFGPSSRWSGNAVTFENEVFTLHDYGQLRTRTITAAGVMGYDAHGYLMWADAETRAWVASRAQAPTPFRWTQTPMPPLRAASGAQQNGEEWLRDVEYYMAHGYDRHHAMNLASGVHESTHDYAKLAKFLRGKRHWWQVWK